MSHFVLPSEEYQRNIDVMGTYISDAALYLNKMSGRPLEACEAYVRSTIASDGKFPMKDPETLVLTKDEKTGDRRQEIVKFSGYLDDLCESKRIISPTMAVYKHPSEERSVLADFVVGNMARRKTIKKEMFAAQMRGDTELATVKDVEQTSVKISNNSLSGAHSSPFTPLYLKSAHSSLTSTCRSATSYGNSNNEKFLFGNRHYWAPHILTANIVRIVNNTDYDKLKSAMDRYGFVPPTHEQVMECITRSTNQYWNNPKELDKVNNLVKSLSPLECAAFVYTGDMYHMAKYNDKVMRTFIDRLSTRADTPVENPMQYIKPLNTDTAALVSLLCAKDLKGDTIWGLDEKLRNAQGDDPVKEEVALKEIAEFGGEEEMRKSLGCIGATAKLATETLDEYLDMFRAFWITPNVPASIAVIPASIRKGAITSDTDSTIFTVQDWVKWFSGEVAFDEKSMGVWYTTVYIASSLIVDILARMCANMGVERDNLHRLAMKNEYAFPVFGLTSRSKHYYAYISAREGNVYKEKELEVKGVALRNSNLPPIITKRAHKLITDSMDTIMEGKKISIDAVMKDVADIERSIIDSVNSGKYEYLASGQVKSIESYRNPDSSPYSHYLMWNEVFAPKYGECDPPTYSSVKVQLKCRNRTQMDAWLSGMEDQALADRFRGWFKRSGRGNIATLILPELNCRANGVPKEVIQAIDIRKLVYGTMEPFYLILESLGIFMQNDNYTRLASDTH